MSWTNSPQALSKREESLTLLRQKDGREVKPLIPAVIADISLTAQQHHDDVLDLADVLGKRLISTRRQRNITIREENAIAALEIMSRFVANPKWLIYLPPPCVQCQIK